MPHWNFRLLLPPLAAQPSVPRGASRFALVVLTAMGAYRAALARALCAGLLFCVGGVAGWAVCAARGRSQIAPTGTQESNFPRVAAQPYLRRDSCSEITWLGIPAWVSKGPNGPSWDS